MPDPEIMTLAQADNFCMGCDNQQSHQSKELRDVGTICMDGHNPQLNCHWELLNPNLVPPEKREKMLELMTKFSALTQEITHSLPKESYTEVLFVDHTDGGKGINLHSDGSWSLRVQMMGNLIDNSSLESLLHNYCLVKNDVYGELNLEHQGIINEAQNEYVRSNMFELFQDLVTTLEEVSQKLKLQKRGNNNQI